MAEPKATRAANEGTGTEMKDASGEEEEPDRERDDSMEARVFDSSNKTCLEK